MAGYTRSDLRAYLTERYGAYYDETQARGPDQDPGQEYFVFGEVYSEGEVQFEDDLTIFEAVMASEPLPNSANLGRVKLIRADPVDPFIAVVNINDLFEGDSTFNFHVQERDIIFITPTMLAQVAYFIKALIFPFTEVIREVSSAFFWGSRFGLFDTNFSGRRRPRRPVLLSADPWLSKSNPRVSSTSSSACSGAALGPSCCRLLISRWGSASPCWSPRSTSPRRSHASGSRDGGQPDGRHQQGARGRAHDQLASAGPRRALQDLNWLEYASLPGTPTGFSTWKTLDNLSVETPPMDRMATQQAVRASSPTWMHAGRRSSCVRRGALADRGPRVASVAGASVLRRPQGRAREGDPAGAARDRRADLFARQTHGIYPGAKGSDRRDDNHGSQFARLDEAAAELEALEDQVFEKEASLARLEPLRSNGGRGALRHAQ